MSSSPRLSNYAWLSIAAALATFFLKMASWWLTGSVGLLSDALESLVNLAASIIALISITVAMRPADEEHAHGHTKAEYFASGMEGALILLAASGIGWNAIMHLLDPHPLMAVGLGLWIAGTASVINLVVGQILIRVARESHSIALEADGQHLMTDVWTSAVVLISIGLVSWTGWNWLDPLMGMAVAVHIIFMGVKLMRQSMLGLMDTSLPPEEMEAIRLALSKFALEGLQYHALRTRVAGAWRFMTVHLLVPGQWTVARGHDVAERVEKEIRMSVPRMTVLTHLEPIEDPVSWEDVELEREKQ